MEEYHSKVTICDLARGNTTMMVPRGKAPPMNPKLALYFSLSVRLFRSEAGNAASCIQPRPAECNKQERPEERWEPGVYMRRETPSRQQRAEKKA